MGRITLAVAALTDRLPELVCDLPVDRSLVGSMDSGILDQPAELMRDAEGHVVARWLVGRVSEGDLNPHAL